MNLKQVKNEMIFFLKLTSIGRKIRKHRNRHKPYSIENAIEICTQFGKIADPKLLADMMEMAQKYSFDFYEYFLLDFQALDLKSRLEFVSDIERIEFCDACNSPLNQAIFEDKEKTYIKFKEYFCRDVCCVRNEYQIAALKKLFNKHGKLIIKPILGSGGRGIKIIDKSFNINDLIIEYCTKGDGLIAEELLRQHPLMERYHKESVNTVRVPTINYGDHVELIHPFFRVGQGNSVVDNASSGGIIIAIDPTTGHALSKGSDEHGKQYERIPGTDIIIEDIQLPQWGEVISLCCMLANTIPSNRYTGWDLALDESGQWVLIEANARGQFLWQYSTHKGFREEANSILEKLNIKYVL